MRYLFLISIYEFQVIDGGFAGGHGGGHDGGHGGGFGGGFGGGSGGPTQIVKVIKIQGGAPSGGNGWPEGGIWPSASNAGWSASAGGWD